jgi:hypothetical protein
LLEVSFSGVQLVVHGGRKASRIGGQGLAIKASSGSCCQAGEVVLSRQVPSKRVWGCAIKTSAIKACSELCRQGRCHQGEFHQGGSWILPLRQMLSYAVEAVPSRQLRVLRMAGGVIMGSSWFWVSSTSLIDQVWVRFVLCREIGFTSGGAEVVGLFGQVGSTMSLLASRDQVSIDVDITTEFQLIPFITAR